MDAGPADLSQTRDESPVVGGEAVVGARVPRQGGTDVDPAVDPSPPSPGFVARLRGWLRPADAALLLVAAGCLLRFLRWWPGRPLWLDEQFLAVNLREGYAAVVGPLEYNQVAPLGWLWTNRALMDLFGSGERVLHLLSFGFGLGTVVVAWLIGRRWLGLAGTVALVALVSLAPDLLRYSVELKQYQSDAFWVLALLGLAGWAVERGTARATVAWWLVAALASWFSMAAIMVTPFLGLVMLLSAVRHRGWPAAVRPQLASLAWVASFLLHHALSLRFAFGNDGMTAYWSTFGYPPEGKGLAGVVDWVLQRPEVLTRDPVRFPPSLEIPLWTLAAVGVVAACVYRRSLGALLAVPFLVGFGMAVAALVPLAQRLALWLVPPLFLAVAVSVRLCVAMSVRWWRESSRDLAAVAALIGVTVAFGFVVLLWPVAEEGGRPPPYLDRVDDRAAMRYIAARHRPGDVVLLTAASWPAYRWYADPAKLRPAAWFGVEEPDPPCDPAAWASWVAGAGRLYLYEGHRSVGWAAHRAMVDARITALGGTKVDSRGFGHAAGVVGVGLVTVYEMGGPPQPGPSDPGSAPCVRLYPSA